MITLFETKNKEYYIESNTNTYFVMDSSGQCRLATSSKIKAKNKMNSILKCVNIDETVSTKDLS